MKKAISILMVLCALLFSSCEKTIDFDGEGTEPMIVVNGLVIAGEPVEVSVTKSESLLVDAYSFEILADAKVDLYVDGEFAETLEFADADDSEEDYNPYYSNESYYLKWVFKGNTIAENGKTYRLEVSREGLQPVSCETTVPASLQMVDVDTSTTVVQYDWGSQSVLGINIKFADDAQNHNFYRVQVDQTTGVNKDYYSGNEESSDTVFLSDQKSLSLNLFDPVFGSDDQADEIISGTPENRYAIFDDAGLNGKEYTLKVGLRENYNPYSLNDGDGNFIKKEVVFYSLSPEYYEYLKSATNHFYYADDYFSEPVPVFSNVQGGMGIFAGIDRTTYSIIYGTYPMEGKVYVYGNYNGYEYNYGYNSY